MSTGDKKEFGFLRSLLWPVHRSELKKVLSMFLILFLVCISYSILRNLKDTVILTAAHSGAEAIPFIKVWGMLPGAIAGTWIYTRLSRVFRREHIFYIMISGFLAYFLLFAFVIHPNCEALHLSSLGDFLTRTLPAGFKGFIALIRNWCFTTFYIICELWATLILTVLFWGFANDNTEVSEGERTYGILNIGSNCAPIIGGALAIYVSRGVTFPFLHFEDPWRQSIVQLILCVTVLGCAAMGLFYWLNRKVIKPVESKEKKEKVKLSVRESLRYISRNKYLMRVAFILLGYYISVNFCDILWKAQLKTFFTDPNEMLVHMNKVSVWTGVFASLGAIFFAFMMRRFGWTFTAMLTPILMVVLAVFFFTFLFFGDVLSPMTMSVLGATPLALTVYSGSMQNCLTKAGKYSVFDASKEMAFLPLDAEAKLRGKAAIDGLGSGIGKSGSSLTYQGLLILLGNVAMTTPYIAVILGVVYTFWISSVFAVGRQFKAARASLALNPQ